MQGSMADWLRRTAIDTGSAAVAMPERIARLDATIGSLESGTFRPRVRVLESERFGRRSGILQVGICPFWRSVASTAWFTVLCKHLDKTEDVSNMSG